MKEVLARLQAAQADLDPQFKALRGVTGALRIAVRLTSEEKADALPMQKALTKLELTAVEVDSVPLSTAVAAFAAVTHSALNDLAYDFAKDLRDEFKVRGETVNGRPPTLSVGILTLKINMAARKGQWFYGREPLTRPIPLSLKGILKAYDMQVKRIINRRVDAAKLTAELRKAWQDKLDEKSRRPKDGRVNLVETYSRLTLNRQNARFWNAPSRSTFKDYERAFFVRDLALLNDQGVTEFRLGVATKSQAEQANRSLWLPESATDGQYYSDITFD